MAHRDSSFIFSGTFFNRKRFATVFNRFKEKNEHDDSLKGQRLIEDGKSALEEEGEKIQAVNKKKKRKTTTSEPVEGFSVFKSSKSKRTDEDDQDAQDEIMQGKKEYYRQLERDAIFRKKYNIHVSGGNVPSPLQSFGELKSRYKSKPYILRNLADIGFKE